MEKKEILKNIPYGIIKNAYGRKINFEKNSEI